MKAHRIYIVGHGQTVRLIRAQTRAQALSHAARSSFTIDVASQDKLVTALLDGVKVENAGDVDSGELFE